MEKEERAIRGRARNDRARIAISTTKDMEYKIRLAALNEGKTVSRYIIDALKERDDIEEE